MSNLYPDFPRDFVWGVATASYQIEGGHDADGRGPGNWDVFCERPGSIYEANNGNFACDHYHRLDEDLDLLAGLGVSAYRFGVSWSRLMPEGTGRVNEKGVAFYNRLIDGLLERKITPYLTLFHWDYPQALEARGGWLNPQSPVWFQEFTKLVADRFGDRVRHYLTLNEPHAFIEGGLRHGRHAPGMTLPLAQVLLAGHHALLAHGLATQTLRANVKNSWITAAPVLISAIPESPTPANIEAARAWTFSMPDDLLRRSAWWMDPTYGRGYPEQGLSQFGEHMPKFTDADLDLIAEPLDAVGFNLYDACTVRAGENGLPEICQEPLGRPRTSFNWSVTPEAHYYGPIFAFERYKLPIVITENGLSNRDWVHLDGQVPDFERVDFIDKHLAELHRAASSVPIAGYFHWSLLDNFEWNHGYRERFGLVHVDYKTFQRTPKLSYKHYRSVIDHFAQS
jgi:beta-glucosidase